MKLRAKIISIFAGALAINLVVITVGLTVILDSLSAKMMKKQAEIITTFLQHRIILDSTNPDDDPDDTNSSIASDFDTAKHISDESKGFDISKILLIKPDYTVATAFPTGEQGKSYAADEDIHNAFTAKGSDTVIEFSTDSDGKVNKYIDVVSYFELENGSPRVIEVKLDFAKSFALLEAQYQVIEIGAISAAVILLITLLGVLLVIIGRTVVSPVVTVTHAMESVGDGNLSVSLPEGSNDEFGLLAKRFNEMVSGLKEKFRLYRYVSQGTIEAVKSTLAEGGGHTSTRIRRTIFFSDIRGFTSYSESKRPEDVIANLNRILSLQSAVIKRFDGDIDKFVGDEVMAVFKDPVAAIDAALEIQQRMQEQRPYVDGLHLGIGLHEGEVVQGDVGSDEIRDFTVIGDTVNTAARLESVAAGDEILISETIAMGEGVKGAYLLQERGALHLKGKEIPIRTYLVNGKHPAPLST